MEHIQFEVAAKTARLIGRENISGVHGAMLELVKNSYDADASFCYMFFQMPFPQVEYNYNYDFLLDTISSEDLGALKKYYNYSKESNEYKASHVFDDNEMLTIQTILFKYNKIIIFDNGSGMTSEVVKESWMRIGTDDKERNYVSLKGRVKTGSKGIGRFALDKLSAHSVMYSKAESRKIVRWEIDWNSFEGAKNLSDITATLEEIDEDFLSIIKKEIGSSFLSNEIINNLETGTMIVLTPTREPWSKRLFAYLNSNLSSINPLNSKDKFDIKIENLFFPEYSFTNINLPINKEDYDYHVSMSFDGKNDITIRIERNELNTALKKFKIKDEYLDEEHFFESEKYWLRPSINRDHFSKNEYHLPLINTYKADEFSGLEKASLNAIGKVDFDFFFVKNGTSDLDIVKRINKKRRSGIISYYSGIRIYRDNFKVRPYGEKESSYYDWLELGIRHQKSPAAVTNLSQPWRVEPYQIIGSLFISRDGNPMLIDMANREGLTPNDAYLSLVTLLQSVIKEFEFDRQYMLREYKRVVDAELDKNKDRAREIIRKSEKKAGSEKKQNDDTFNNSFESHSDNNYNKDDYQRAVDYLVELKNNNESNLDVLFMLGVSGITTNTFAHELSYLSNQIKANASQLKLCLKRHIKEKECEAEPLYNPYKKIDDNKKIEKIVSSWVNTLTNGVKPESQIKKRNNVNKMVMMCLNDWKDLLNDVFVDLVFETNNPKGIYYLISMSDIYLLLNNFILNSVSFLENYSNKTIWIDLLDHDDYFIIQMENNGKPMESVYVNNPKKMFELRQSTKPDGTGIGLWMVSKVVDKYSGDIFFHKLTNGTFGFSIRINKDKSYE